MPIVSDISLIPTGIIVLLAAVYIALQPSHPERKSLPRQRMIRIAATVLIEFVVMAIVIERLFAVSAESILPTNAAEGRITVVAWARAELAAGPPGAVLIGVILVVLAAIAVSVQYILARTFSLRTQRSQLDSLARTTGTAERVVYAIDTVIVAGIGEEVVFRALLPAALYALTSSTAAAILVSWLVFVALHYNQGYRGLLNAALVGAAVTALYLVTQQLWWSIALHAFSNLAATVVVPEILRARVRRVARRAIGGQTAHEQAVQLKIGQRS